MERIRGADYAARAYAQKLENAREVVNEMTIGEFSSFGARTNDTYLTTKVGDLCKELGITRQTLCRHVAPRGELRPDSVKLLALA
ncbi:hypothetical protein ACH51_20875 (plasmid) [Ralstonia solanacearum]|nr:hypothetical protein ACH51_20875 [Ralstonia solanacearum]